jgi:hypothetical protein
MGRKIGIKSPEKYLRMFSLGKADTMARTFYVIS